MSAPSSSSTTASLALDRAVAPKLTHTNYPVWKPLMETHLMRLGVLSMVTKEIDRFEQLVKKTEEWENAATDALVEAALGKKSQASGAALAASAAAVAASKPEPSASSDGAGADAAAEAAAKEEATTRKQVKELVANSQRAYAVLFEALPEDVRPLVAHLPAGYAFALWNWLRTKYQSTEVDTVGDLISQWMQIAMGPDESFDSYRARVNELSRLLTAAKEKPSSRVYAYVLLDKLQPRYKQAVLALKAGDKLKDVDKINWDEVTAFINSHERSEQRLEAAEHVSEHKLMTMMKRFGVGNNRPGGFNQERNDGFERVPPKKPAKQKQQRPLSEMQCWNCQEYGHAKRNCPSRSAAASSSSSASQGPAQAQQGNGGSGKQVKSLSIKVSADRYESLVHSDADGATPVQVQAQPQAAAATQQAKSVTFHRVHVLRSYSDAVQGRKGTVVVEPDSAAPATPAIPQSEPPKVQSAPESSGSAPAAAVATAVAVCSEEKECAVPPVQAAASNSKALPVVAIATPIQSEAAPLMRVSSVSSEQLKAESDNDDRRWGIDSHASISVSGYRHLFTELRRCQPAMVECANKNLVVAHYKGSMRLQLMSKDGKRVTATIKDVFYHESFAGNLLSWCRLRARGWELHSGEETYLVTPGKHQIELETHDNVLTFVEARSAEECTSSGAPAMNATGRARVHHARGVIVHRSVEDLVRLHERLNHVGFDRMIGMIRAGATDDIGQLEMDSKLVEQARSRVLACEACAKGKGQRPPLGHAGLDHGSRAVEVLHLDTFEVRYADQYTSQPELRGQRCYGLVVADPYTEKMWLEFRKSKADIPQAVIDVIKRAETQSDEKVKRIFSDGGTEFINDKVRAFCRDNGKELYWSPAGRHDLHGIAERYVRTTKDGVRTLVLHADLPLDYYQYAAKHFEYVWNRTHVARATKQTPYEALRGSKPSIGYVSVFGCDVYASVPKERRFGNTFKEKMEPGVYLGHDEAQNCARVYLLASKKVVHTRDVDFRETSFKHAEALREGAQAIDLICAREYVPVLMSQPSAAAPSVVPSQQGSSPRDAESKEQADARGDRQQAEHAAQDSEEDEPAGPEEAFEVERILNHRVHTHRGRRTTEYQVKWAGYDEPTWEPEANLAACDVLLPEYKRTHMEQPRAGLVAVAPVSSVAPSVAPAAAAAREEKEDAESGDSAFSTSGTARVAHAVLLAVNRRPSF